MRHAPHPKTYLAVTDDGWKIALHRYPRKSNRKPALLVHGLASNRHNLDFPIEDLSLARYLWRKGWDTWVIELRGAGKSSKPSGFQWLKGWKVDHYILHDLPAAIRLIQEKSGHKKLHWVGHSLGGLLIPPFINKHSDEVIKSAAVAASPFSGLPEKFFKWTVLTESIMRVLPYVPNRMFAKVLSLSPEIMLRGPFPSLFVRNNLEEKTLRLGAKIAFDDVPVSLMKQFHKWMRSKKFKSEEGDIRYDIDFKRMKIPFLMIAGSHDPFTPKNTQEEIYRRIGTSKKRFVVLGKEFGHTADYSHWDLILGRHASQEVFPLIADWLSKHDR